MIERVLGDDGELVLRAHLRLQLISHNRAAKTGAHDDDVGHVLSSPRGYHAMFNRSSVVVLYHNIYIFQLLCFCGCSISVTSKLLDSQYWWNHKLIFPHNLYSDAKPWVVS